MPKAKGSTPVKSSKRTAVVEDEEEEHTVSTKASKNGATRPNGKVAVAATKKTTKVKSEEEMYVPNKDSMRALIMSAMKKGGSSADIKKRAARFAAKRGLDSLDDVKAYKNFDVAYFAKFLKSKGYDVEIDEESDSYTLTV